jgi:hypothetical protein
MDIFCSNPWYGRALLKNATYCARKLILIAWAVVAKRQLIDPEHEKQPLLALCTT